MKKITLAMILFCQIAFFAQAQETQNQTSGTCGENCAWEMNDGVLKLNGYGYIKGYDLYSAPWFWNSNNIKKIVIENQPETEGFKSIGNTTFCAMTQVKEVVLPETMEKIGSAAFHYCLSLEKINLPDSLTNIAWAAFNDTSISNFILPENVKVESNAFGSFNLSSIAFSGNTDVNKNALEYSTDWKTYQISPNLNSIYCEQSNQSCIALLEDEDIKSKVITYTKSGGMYIANGKQYRSLAAMQKGNTVKRIYTVDEAAKVSKKSDNTFKIRYK